VLTLAHDVACAMLHLHKERIVHGDLKASNVLLSTGNTPCGHIADVASAQSPARAATHPCQTASARFWTTVRSEVRTQAVASQGRVWR
jgi:serine/threonine protein kinase